MTDILKKRDVRINQIESIIINITGRHASQLDQAGIHAMVNAVNANWDTLAGVLNNDAQRGTALATLFGKPTNSTC